MNGCKAERVHRQQADNDQLNGEYQHECVELQNIVTSEAEYVVSFLRRKDLVIMVKFSSALLVNFHVGQLCQLVLVRGWSGLKTVWYGTLYTMVSKSF